MKFFTMTIYLILMLTTLSCSIDTVPIGNPDSGGKTLVRGDLEVASGKTLKVDKIESTSGGQPEGGVPSGSVMAFAGDISTPPSGWLACDGSEVSQTTYAKLYAAIGSTWNTATNPTTGAAWAAPSGGNFRLPDLRGSFLRGVGTPHVGDAQTLAGFQNDKTAKNALQNSSSSVSTGSCSANQSSHSHNIRRASSTGTVLTLHTGSGSNSSGLSMGNGTVYQPLYTGGTDPSISCSIGGTWTAAAQTITGDTETRPINVGVNYIIKI